VLTAGGLAQRMVGVLAPAAEPRGFGFPILAHSDPGTQYYMAHLVATPLEDENLFDSVVIVQPGGVLDNLIRLQWLAHLYQSAAV
jgi:hypothetical protein